jgi:hypothetical protein
MNNSLGVGLGVLCNIPFIKEFHTPTTGAPIGGDSTSMPAARLGGGTRMVRRERYHPGTVPELRNGAKYQAGPLTQMRNDAVMAFLAYLLKRIGTFWTLPGFMMGAEADSQLYSSVLAIGSPFVIRREQDQIFYGEKYIEIIEKALRIAWETGQISRLEASFERLMSLIEIDYEAPKVALTNELEQSEANRNNVEAGIVSLQTAREQTGLDPEKEQQRAQADPQPQGDVVAEAFDLAQRNPRLAANKLRESWEAYP